MKKKETKLPKYIVVLTFLVLFLFNNKSYAQTTYEDSLYFTTVFQTPVYINRNFNPGIFYIHSFVQTRAGLFDSLNNLMKFGGSDYYGSYNNIQVRDMYPVDSINNTMNYYFSKNKINAYKQRDPIWSLPFSLNGKQSTTYCTYTPTTNTENPQSNKTAVLFITGSGTNNGTAMVRGEGYQNIYGFQKDSLATLGDVYIAIRPLIDFRAFVWDRVNSPAALNSEFPIPNQISSYLNGRGTPYGVNCLIESIALVKYLKSKYQRVIIAGLSYGGQYTTLNTLESAPEGALVSGGYTILVDETSQTNNYQMASFGSLFYSLNRDSVKNNIGKSTTEFLFSWGKDGDVYEESHLHATQNYFAALNNTQYYYDYGPHTFPPFQAFKNLFDSVNNRPSVRIRKTESICASGSAKILLTFCGQKPYHFDIYKDSIFFNSYLSTTDTFSVDINEAGNYKVKNLMDSNNIPGFNSDDYVFKPNSNIDVQLIRQDWICNTSQRNRFGLTGGQGPWDIYYRENGVSKSNIFYNSNLLDFFWTDGTYIIDSINNYGNCVKYINDTIVVNSNISKQEDLFNAISYNYELSKMQFTFKNYFNGFTKIVFTRDGILDSLPIQGNTLFLSNGNYQFTELKNGDDCSFPINLSYIIKKDPMDLSSIYMDNWQIKTDNPGSQYVWFYKGKAFDTTQLPSTRFVGNGIYEVEITNGAYVSRTKKGYFYKGQLVTYPNPFKNQFTLFIELPANERAILDIYDGSGRKIESMQIKNGINPISLKGTKKGGYILKVRYKGKGFNFDTMRMIKL